VGAAKTVGAQAAPIVHVRGLAKQYGARHALRGVDLRVERGEVYGLIGPDGAGKSSLLKAVAGVLTFDAGEIDVLGVRIDSELAAERIKGRLGLMPQGLGFHLYPELSVEENVDFFARIRLVNRSDLERRKRRLLDITRLAAFRDRPMKQLSGGMKQKLGLVCTLIHQPELIVLDEPTTGVDPLSRRDFWALLADLLRDAETTALVSTAYMDEATRFDRVSLMFDGRIVADLTGDALRETGTTLEDTFIAVLRRLNLVPAETATPAAAPPAARRHSDAVAIEAVHMSRRFGRFVAVDDVSFRVRQGEIFGLVGPNGAGKSTIIKMLTGIVMPTAGSARVAGVDIRTARQAVKQRIGYMSQVFSLYRDLSVVENVRLYAGIYGLDAAATRERLAWILEMAALEGRENTLADDLPMGLRQRLALGCALVHRPEILFLDEPTSGVDPIGRRRFWEILMRLTRDEGVAALVTTHYMSEAEHCDRLGLMYAGRLAADATPGDLRREVSAEIGSSGEAALSMEDVFVHRIMALERAGATPRSAA
jgi:ABC-type multidrug transport system ATPase subunit